MQAFTVLIFVLAKIRIANFCKNLSILKDLPVYSIYAHLVLNMKPHVGLTNYFTLFLILGLALLSNSIVTSLSEHTRTAHSSGVLPS